VGEPRVSDERLKQITALPEQRVPPFSELMVYHSPVRDLAFDLLDARTALSAAQSRIEALEAVARAAALVVNLEDDATLRSAIENQRLRDGETLTVQVGGGPSALWTARESLRALLSALGGIGEAPDG
jgi:hypothetical protein